MKKIKHIFAISYLIFLTIIIFVLLSKFSLSEILSFEFIKLHVDKIAYIRENSFFKTFFIFIILGIIWIIFQGFASPLVLISGFIFGYYYSVLIAVLTLSIGSIVIFLISNIYLKDFILKNFKKKYKELGSKFKKNELLFMIIFRMIGGIPFQIQNIIPCLFNVGKINYFFGTFIGLIPQAFIFTSIGVGLEKNIYKFDELPSFFELFATKEIYIPILFFFIFLTLVFMIKRFLNN